jgi:hypothetical protein
VTKPRRSLLARFLRLYLWALLAALVMGFGFGLWVRYRMERHQVQMGSSVGQRAISVVSATTPAP